MDIHEQNVSDATKALAKTINTLRAAGVSEHELLGVLAYQLHCVATSICNENKQAANKWLSELFKQA